MDTFEAIESRRAIKHFEPDFDMPETDEKKILHAIRQAPTSFNLQNYRIVNVKDKNLRIKLREAAWDQAQVTEASLLFVMCADVKAWDKNPERWPPKKPKIYWSP